MQLLSLLRKVIAGMTPRTVLVQETPPPPMLNDFVVSVFLLTPIPPPAMPFLEAQLSCYFFQNAMAFLEMASRAPMGLLSQWLFHPRPRLFPSWGVNALRPGPGSLFTSH